MRTRNAEHARALRATTDSTEQPPGLPPEVLDTLVTRALTAPMPAERELAITSIALALGVNPWSVAAIFLRSAAGLASPVIARLLHEATGRYPDVAAACRAQKRLLQAHGIWAQLARGAGGAPTQIRSLSLRALVDVFAVRSELMLRTPAPGIPSLGAHLLLSRPRAMRR